MLRVSYEELDAAEKLGLISIANNDTLYMLIDIEIGMVKAELCALTPGLGLDIPYAIIQQRLISLQDLKAFFNHVRKETTPQSDTE